MLDHRDYSWTAAQPGLSALKQHKAGLVLASSKTAAELQRLRADIGFLDWPAIVENGAGILWPDQDVQSDDADYQRLRAILASLPKGFVGFGDMTAQDVADKTGLSPDQAVLARRRCYSEPGLWTGTEDALAGFLDAAQAQGVHARRGGRFLTLSFGRTKADAMADVVARLKPLKTVALGDAPNDIEMIEAADFGVIVANPAAPRLAPLCSEAQGRTLRSELEGPSGWAAAILTLLAQLKVTEGTPLHG
ncbi:MAG: mannosyl-3-phosphoglycerate phosphatase [Paracoccaceae bacterium]